MMLTSHTLEVCPRNSVSTCQAAALYRCVQCKMKHALTVTLWYVT